MSVNNLSRLNFSPKNLSGQAKALALSLPNEVKLDKSKAKNWLLRNGVEPTQRAETLSIEDWVKLVKSYRSLEK